MAPPLTIALPDLAEALVGAMIQQTRYDTRDILLAAYPDVYSRFMITALRDKNVGDPALATAGMGAFLGFACDRAEVLLILSEDNEQRVRERMRALGVANAPDGLFIFTRTDLPKLSRQFGESMSFETWLGVWLRAHPKVRLVVLDTESTVRQAWRD